MDCSTRRKALYTVGLCLVLFPLVASSGAWAGVKPGDTIGPPNAAEVKSVVSPGVYYAVTHGMRMNIVPTSAVEWPAPFREATEKYSQQVRLSEDHRSLIGFVAGQPFPLIDFNDPNIAEKLIWNNVFRPINSDDYDLRFFDCQTEYITPGQDQRVIDEIEIGHYAGYDLIGRTEVEPTPFDPDFKQTNRMWMFALYPILAPENQRGEGVIRYRYADPSRGDDSWDWTPGTRRVRRLNEAILSSAMGAQTYDLDHYSGFNPKTEQYDYKFLGAKSMLGCVHGTHSPEMTCPYDGGGTACPEDWEMRQVYIVDACPRRDGKGANNALDRDTVIYMDAEAWFEPYVDSYDRKGQLWRTHIYWLTFRDRPVPDARVAVYPFKREFVVGAASIDTQGGISTMCYLPGQHTPERECWYINMGAISKEFFTVKSMVSAAP